MAGARAKLRGERVKGGGEDAGLGCAVGSRRPSDERGNGG